MSVYKGKLVNFQLYALIRYLQSPSGRTVGNLVSLMGVSRASVYRYLTAVEDMGFPLTSETRGREVYYFFDMDDSHIARNIFENLPLLKDDFLFDKDEKLLIEFLFTNAEGSVPLLKDKITSLHRKMQTLLSFAGHVADVDENEQVSLERRGVSVVHSILDFPKRSESDKMEIVSVLCDAVQHHRVCSVVYKSAAETTKQYDIMPLIVFSYYGGIYTVVETRNHDYWSKLAIERIISLTLLEEHFERKTGFDLEYSLSDPFGLIQGDQFEIEVLLDETNAKYLMEREWPQNRVSFSKPDKDGWVHFKCITSGEFELLRWLRYMGKGVKLIKPEWLVAKLKRSIEDLSKQYD